MVSIKMKGAKKLPRSQLIGKLVRMEAEPSAVIDEKTKSYKYLDLLFLAVDKDLKPMVKKGENGAVLKNEDGTDKMDWKPVRVYLTTTDKDKKSITFPLTKFPEAIKADDIITRELAKGKDAEKKFPICSMQVYTKLAEVEDKIYKNLKASPDDFKMFKVIAQ